MTSPYKEIPITFEKGLVTEIEESLLDVGQAASLENWEPLPNGALRSRNAWSPISITSLVPNLAVRGWGTVAVESGGGYSTPSIVQTAEDATAGSEATKSVTLTGCTAGNIMVAAVCVNGAGDPTVSAGYTKQSEANDGFPFFAVYIYTKVSVGGSETFQADYGSLVYEVQLYELSGVATEAPTATDSGSGGTLDTMSIVSAAASGVAISIGAQASWVNPWDDPPGGEAGWTQDGENVEVSNNYNVTVASKVYSASPVTDTIDPSAGGGSDNVWLMGIWDAETSASTPADFYILVAVATSTGYSIYRISRDAIQTGVWELVDSAVCTDTSAFVSMGVSAGYLIWSASTMDNPRSVVISTLTGADVTDLSSKAGRVVASHKDRVFVAGSADEPQRLYFSGIGAPTSFTTATDYLDIGGDDGEAIEDLVSVEGLLLVCKTNRLYLVSGSGIESFFVNELPGGTAATGRAAIRTPYGTIVAGPADIWVVQGGGVDPMSRSLGADYSISGLVSTAYAQDSVFILDGGTNTMWRVNLVTGAWAKETVSAGENVPYHLFSLQGRLYYGVQDSDTKVGGTRRLSSARSYDALTAGTSFLGSTGRMALLGPSVKYTPRWLFVQSRNLDTDFPNTLWIDIESDHGTTTKDITVSSSTQRDRVDIPGMHQGSEWIKLTFRADSSAIAGAIDPERIVLGVDVEAPR